MKREESNAFGSWANRASVQIARTVKGILLGKKILLVLPIMLVPFFIALYMLFDPPDGMDEWPELFVNFGVLIFMQLLVLMFSLVYGTSMLNNEMESKTLTYLIMRGSKRFEVLLYKFVGVHISLTVLMSFSVIMTYGALAVHTSWDNMLDHLVQALYLIIALFIGSFAYLSLFSFLGVVFRRPLVVGLIFSFFWEVFMVNIPLNVQQVTLMYYIRSIFLGPDTVSKYIDISEKASVEGSILALFLTGSIFLILASLVISGKDVN